MAAKDLIGVAGIILVLFGLTYIASSNGQPVEKESVLAEAIKADFADFFGDRMNRGATEPLEPFELCLEADEVIDFLALADGMNDTVIRPVPFESCRRETEEGDFGMFTAIHHHFGPNGDDAAHLKVVKIECDAPHSCVIDLDRFGGGDRYIVERKDKSWKVVERRMRWVV